MSEYIITEEQADSLAKRIQFYEKMPDEIEGGIIGEPDVVMVRFNNLWLGIEADGYTHS
jgi:hypothetical protein